MNMSASRARLLLVLGTLCFLPAVALTQGGLTLGDAIYVDFGSSGNATPGNWNNMTNADGSVEIENAVAASGAVTAIDFTLPDRSGGINENGTQEPDAALGLPMEATRDSFWGNDVLFSSVTEPTARLVISDLDASASYELTIFSSRMDVSDVRQTEYAISGADGLQQTLYLDPANNVDTQAVSKGIRPTAAGEIIIDIQKGPDNNNSYGFYYIGALALRVAQNLAATQPSPASGAIDVATDVTLGWTPGQLAAAHNVYFGADADAVANATVDNPLGVLVSEGQTANSYDLEMTLELGQTYYWRVDEVNGAPDFAVSPGEVWSFTAEPVAYPIANVTATASAAEEGSGPENTVNGSGLNENDEHSIEAPDMWLADSAAADVIWIQYEFDQAYKLHELLVWNYNIQFEPVVGFGLKDVTIETSTDGATWAAVANVPEFAQGTASPDYTPNTVIDLSGIVAQYVRLTVNGGWGALGQFGLSEVRFLYIPVQPREPQPADGATDVSPDSILSWRAGREAVSHEVSLSTDAQAIADGTALVDAPTEASYAPSDLAFGTTYYWKVSEINEDQTPAAWAGPMWTFMTQDYAVIDDMESYNDEDNLIYETWIDGWTNETGSTVGYMEAPFAETTIVHGGAQSLPLTYDNSSAPFYSEAECDLGGMDLDGNGADTLRLFVQGQTPAFLAGTDGTVRMSAIGADIWGTADQCRYAYKSLTGDGSIVARVDYLDGAPSTWAKAGVMIRQDTEVGSMHALTALTGGDGGGAAFQRRIETDGESTSDHDLAEAPFAAPTWVKVERVGNAFSSFVSHDGETWTQAGEALMIAMADPVLIGLATTSHNASVATSAEFSNVSTTGNVTGSWQMAEIGVAQPTGGNDLATLYVAVEDSAGKVAVATHPDAAVRSGWTEWLIPYGDLAGVNLNSVRTMTIGLGDRDNPSAGGSGLVFIDDIGFGHPATE